MSIEPTSSPGRQYPKAEPEEDPPDRPDPHQRGSDLALVLLTVAVSGLGSMLTTDGLSVTAAAFVVIALAVIAIIALWTVYTGRR